MPLFRETTAPMPISAAMPPRPLSIAVVGGGISGLSAAWLLARGGHDVTLFEAETRLGGHSHTVEADGIPVDTGFIVYNEQAYPNLTALFAHLKVPTRPAEMTFAVSLDEGRLEYSGTDLGGLFAQKRNLASPRFWAMLRDLLRFYRKAPADVAKLGQISLDDYLAREGYGAGFREDHLYPMAAAVWSTPVSRIGAYPAASFIRFCENHGLLKLADRPIWRTVDGGSRVYVAALARALEGRVRMGVSVRGINRVSDGVKIVDAAGDVRQFDHVVIAAHADQAMAMLEDTSDEERRLLRAFTYQPNEAVLHSDAALMPRRRRVWSSWNYASERGSDGQRLSVTYWMNPLQGISNEVPLFLTLNPLRQPRADSVIHRQTYHHPLFDAGAMAAQRQLWSLQGVRGTWFCGAWFGAGFHEDGLQAGLAVAEQLGGVRRPWSVAEESGRIHLGPAPTVGEPS